MPAVHPRTFREIRRVLIDVVLLDGEQDSAPSLADMAARAKALLGKTEPRKHTVKVPPPAGARGTREARKEAQRRETAEIRAFVRARSGDIDELTGTPTISGELHHLDSGSGKSQRQSVQNCVWVSAWTHREYHRDPHGFDEAVRAHCKRYGYAVPRRHRA